MAMDLINNRYIQASHHIIRWLSESLRLRERIIDRLLQYYCILDENGKILKGGAPFAQLWGIDTLDSLVRKHVSELLEPEVWDQLRQDLETARNSEDEASFRTFRTHRGSVVWQVKQVRRAVANKLDLYILCGTECDMPQKGDTDNG